MIETDGPPPAVEKSPEQNPTKLRFNVTNVETAAKELERKGVGVRRAVDRYAVAHSAGYA